MNQQNLATITNKLCTAAGCLVPPIEVVKIARHLRVKVYAEKLPEDISGILDVRNEPVILINKDHALHRQRFSIAHELGHFQLHHLMGIIHVDKKSYYRDSKSAEGLDDIEIAANKFAAELLMPEAMIRSELEKHDDFIDMDEDMVAEMAKKFNVSTTAMGFRIQNLGYSWL
ncbi:MAG: ImmA/IrrE family metallo-endopeptidase [Bacteroidales bacterium]|jgi:Zn-dependent peptidase ImmA (M78 family)|nr:ImmA/IrrE family metallo-endopeptidase [Bacteroidales bacterium]